MAKQGMAEGIAQSLGKLAGVLSGKRSDRGISVDGRVLTLTRVFDAPRDLVWTCFTDPKHMQHWWGPKGVTVVDDGTIASRRGSLSIDDEGTPTNRTVLIEDGVLVGYMQDRQNARLMNMKPTGNGRRQGYAHVPMPRMTNTYMLAGGRDPAEILASVKNGIYAANFGGGQVDITSGKYVFQCTEAYRIENGKVGAPLKGAMLIGNGPTDLHKISMIGNDLALDTGIGTCGKNGQGVPVGVGQPTLRMDRITVGGTG